MITQNVMDKWPRISKADRKTLFRKMKKENKNKNVLERKNRLKQCQRKKQKKS